MGVDFRYKTFIGLPAEDVWDALTIKSMVDRYYMAPLAELNPGVGGSIRYGAEGADVITGIITEIEAPRSLVHTFRFVESPDPESTVRYEIEPIGEEMCSLEITHTGLDPASATFTDISAGWPVIASSLKTLLETGFPLPWPM